MRPHRAHLDDQFSRNIAGKEPGWAGVDRLDRLRIRQDGDHRLDPAGKLGRRSGNRRAGSGEHFDLFGRSIPHGEFVADLHQTCPDGGAHAANAGDPDLHAGGSAP